VENSDFSSLEIPQALGAPSKLAVTTTSPGHEIRFSSPMPWITAIVLSVAIWAVIGWFFSRLFHG
jgi:hypothetical protein